MSYSAKCRRVRRRSIVGVLLAPAAILGVGCGGDSTAPKEPPPPSVAEVAIAPSAPSILVGDTVRLTATPKDVAGAALADRPVSWASSDDAVATVDAEGLVAAHAAGTATITATVEGQHGDVDITVHSASVATVTLTPDTGLVVVGDTLRLIATPVNAEGDTLDAQTITWSSSDTTVATVDASGLVTARTPDSVTITAAAGTEQASARLHAARRFSQVYTGGDRSCGLSPAGKAYCWGRNSLGDLGDGTTTDRLEPVPVAGGLVFAQLALGYNHGCGLTGAGTAYCWGYNSDGEVGDGTTTDRLAPVPVARDLTFTQLVAGDNHTCGLTAAGTGYCWGYNTDGQLGDGTTTNRATPTSVVSELVFTRLGAGGSSTCGVTEAGAAYCWGDNSRGQLGDSTTTSSTTPVAVTGGLAFTAIDVGFGHACALTSDGSAYCWGVNGNGELGDGTTTPSRVPVAVTGGVAFSELSLSSNGAHSCGVSPAHVAYCWGPNSNGQLGDGTRVSRAQPTVVLGGLSASHIAAGGGGFACLVTTDQMAYCWGVGGGLGDGTTTDRPTPTPVAGQQ